jgi:hypothetical protein
LSDCGSYKDQCDGNIDVKEPDFREDRTPIECFINEEIVFEDYGVCVDDKKHYISQFSIMDISLPLSNVYHYGYKMTIEAK